MRKFRSLSRTTPNFSLRGEGDDRDGGRAMKQQQDQHRLKTSPSQEHQFSRRNTSNEARRRFHSTDETTTLPIPKRGKSLPSRLKVSMRLSRDSQHPQTGKNHTNSNHHSSRSRSRNRSSARGAIRSKSQSISHGKKGHVSFGQRLGDKQPRRNPLTEYYPTSAKDKNDTSHRHPRSSPSRKTHANHQNRIRSKSLPSTGILRNDILHVDRHQSIKNLISPIASIDSSWRYKRITMLKRLQRHRQRQPQGRNSDNVHYEKERIRSVSCDPSMLRLALVPYHAKQQTNNKKTYLNYNLGEMDEELFELLRQQGSRWSLDSTSLKWPSRSSPKTSMPWGRSRRCGVSTPTNDERSSRGGNDKFVTSYRSSSRFAGNGGEDFSHITSTGEVDIDTTGWQGHAPDPVKSLHGSSNLAEDLTYQNHHLTPYSLPLPEQPPMTGPSSPDNSRESFIGIIENYGGWSSGKKSNYSESSGEDRRSSRSMLTPSSQTSPSDPITKHDDDNDNDDSDSPKSMLNKTTSTHAKYEKKIDSGFLVPPLHSMVRSRKPKAKVGPISPHHHRSHSHHHLINVKPGDTVKHSVSIEFKSRSSVGVVEGMIVPEQDSESPSARMSEVTMPLALSRVPPPHEFIRSVKPQNRVHGYSSHPTSPVTRHPKSESHKHHPEGMPPQFLSALRAIHQVNTSLEHSNKSLEHPPKAAPVSLYPPPPPRRMAPGPAPRNQYKQAMNQEQQQQQQYSANVDIPTRQVKSQTHPAGMIPKTTLDDLNQAANQLRSERHHHSDRALFPPQVSRDRYVEMTGGSHPGILHSSMRDLSMSNSSNNWQLHQLLHSSTTELARMQGTILPEREEHVGGGQQLQAPPISSIGGSTIARQRGKRVENMPFMDENQDMGLYTGETNDLGQPHGKGQMRYDNGIFFEGKWSNGVQDGVGASRERLLSGFTSWKVTKQSKKNGTTTGKEFAHGMIWVNPFNGRSGRYTGDLNQHGMPHGRGVMRYDFGLIAEGEWNNGQLIDDSFQCCPVPAALPAGSVGGNYFPSL